MTKQVSASFIEPMLLLRTERLPEGPEWLYEIKLDGYRAIAMKAGGKIRLRSRNDNDFSERYSGITKALGSLPNETVVDGELVAFDAQGKPSFNLLQNYGSRGASLHYYVFDVLVIAGKDVREQPLAMRRQLLEKKILPKMAEPIRYLPELSGSLNGLIQSVKTQGLEGLVAKRKDGLYEAGQRSGAWLKMRINKGQEFVIGGYTVGAIFDALIFGYYEGKRLIYAARTRNGFTPRIREQLMKQFRTLESSECPFSNLPEKRSGRWGAGLTAAKMTDCRWLKPELVAQFEFLEWTGENHLRHTKYIALRNDKMAKDVRRES